MSFRQARITDCRIQRAIFASDARQSLEILKDIIAIANSGGGTLAIGINNSGESSGADVKPVLNYDHAKYCDLIKKYTMQNFADFELVEVQKSGHSVAIFLINPPDAPLVFEKPGTYPIENGRQNTAFSQGTFYFRHGAKTETGTTEDLRRFMANRMREMQKHLMKDLRKVAEAPRGSQIQVIPPGRIIRTTARARGDAVAVRVTNNPDAQGVIALDRDRLYPYRQKDVIRRLESILGTDRAPNAYYLQTIVKVYDIKNRDDLSWEPQYSSRQYSEAFVEFIVEHMTANPDFLVETRQRLTPLNRGNNRKRKIRIVTRR